MSEWFGSRKKPNVELRKLLQIQIDKDNSRRTALSK